MLATGKVSRRLWAEAFGASSAAYDIAFAFGLDTPAAERKRITGSVMASIDLTWPGGRAAGRAGADTSRQSMRATIPGP